MWGASSNLPAQAVVCGVSLEHPPRHAPHCLLWLWACWRRYELAGVVTNLLAGLMGARWGIKWTLLCGLTLQLAGLGMLFGWKVRDGVAQTRVQQLMSHHQQLFAITASHRV